MKKISFHLFKSPDLNNTLTESVHTLHVTVAKVWRLSTRFSLKFGNLNGHLGLYLWIILFYTLFLFKTTPLSAQTEWTAFTDSTNNFSSPRATDLNKDGVLDIVVGGGLEDFARSQSVSAFDGKTGNVLWRVSARNQMFGSALFGDITGDEVDDVFIAGRDAELIAVNGATGEVIWEFFPQGDTESAAEAGLYNFYTCQWIPDQNNDGIRDLLTANGGDKFATPLDLDRPTGNIMVVSGLDGSQIAKVPVPDGKETYLSPLVHDFLGNGNLEVIFGSGGETIEGSLWRVSLADVLNEDLSNAVALVSNNRKGYIPPPSLADMNGDGVHDIIVAGYGEKITAISGKDNSILWENGIDKTETVASPAMGQFTNDTIPDIFTIVGEGIAPVFLRFIALMIDGKTGEILEQDTLAGWSIISPLAVDFNGDGKDEAVFCVNKNFAQGAPFQSQWKMWDFQTSTVSDLTSLQSGTNLGSTAWIGDLENDGLLDFVYSQHSNSSAVKPDKGFFLRRKNLSATTPEHIAWGAYMGTDFNGVYTQPIKTDIEAPPTWAENIHIFPNPNRQFFRVEAELPKNLSAMIRLYNLKGELLYERKMKKGKFQEVIDTKDFAVGVYLLEVKTENGTWTEKVVVK
ncbi:MAG: T9SS type A sorting domain-containing protein [Chitinophagales bacterium]